MAGEPLVWVTTGTELEPVEEEEGADADAPLEEVVTGAGDVE